MLCIVAAFAAACGGSGDSHKPEKLKDGIALTITEGESKSIDLSEYISVAGTGYAYTVNSSAPNIATVSVDGNTATVVAAKEGNATVTASADTVSVTFAVTVSAKQQVTPDPVKADKTALVAELALEVAAQGDYTSESYAAYTKNLQTAKTVNAKSDATQKEVDTACSELKAAREGLVLRVPEEVDGAEKTLVVISGLSKEITISDYIDAKNLSSVTYEVSAANALITVGEISEGKFTVTAGETNEDKNVALTICAKYKGESKLSVTLTLQVKSEPQPVVKQQQVTQSLDIYALEDKTALVIDFTQNIESNGVENLTYSVTTGGNAVTLDGDNRLTYNFDGTYSETATTVVFNVTVGYGVDKSVSYTYTLNITDTTSYRAANGGFSNGLDGWTMTGDMGEISENSTFWEQNFPVFNNGKYFSGNNKESGTGTLTSPEFTVGGSNKITFMLGAAGNPDCYITLEKGDGTVLAIWRNTKFKDIGNWDMNEIGKTQFACNLVTYVADLTEYTGQTLKIVLHDNAVSGFGFFNFDELVTYYTSADEVPEGAVAAVNELADKTALQAAVDGALTAQGDYTEESYNAYLEKVIAAQVILNKVSATQTEADTAKTAIETAFAELTVRVPEEKAGANKSFNLLVNGSKELALSDYVDEKNLSSLTYEVKSADTKVTVGEISEGKFTVTADSDETTGASVTIDVKYKGSTVLTVTVTVTVTSETAPLLKETAVETNIDLYSAENKTDITLDFASNVDNVGGLDLTYTVTLDGANLTLDGTSYTYTYESYTESATAVVFVVTVAYTQNGTPAELNYSYTLNLKDTRAYRITNGGFDNGLDGWTLSNPDLGGVNNAETYWNESIPFNNEGNFFNAYYFNGGAKENAMGKLTSSPFTLGGSGWITYKLGGAKNADKVYLDVIEKDTGKILARYYNNAFSDDGANTEVRGCTLVAYKANLSEHIGKTVYIRLSDNAINDYGLFFVDSFVTYYPAAPTEGNVAVAVENTPANIYQLQNGGFEDDLNGWTVVTTEGPENEIFGALGDADATWGENCSYNNDGKFFQNMNEQCKGYLMSASFTVSENGWMSFKLGGNKAHSYVSIIDANTGAELARFVNEKYVGAWPNNGWEMYSYKVNLIESGIVAGTDVRIKVVDDAVGDYGVVVVDSFAVYAAEPDGDYQKINKVQ